MNEDNKKTTILDQSSIHDSDIIDGNALIGSVVEKKDPCYQHVSTDSMKCQILIWIRSCLSNKKSILERTISTLNLRQLLMR